MSSPHPNLAAGSQARLVEPAYMTMTPAEEAAALGALGRLLAWAATQPTPAPGCYRHGQRSAASMMHPPPG
ncbi:MAG: hypothetical protein ACYDH5_14755 [Acidimicrobiales bacterium]